MAARASGRSGREFTEGVDAQPLSRGSLGGPPRALTRQANAPLAQVTGDLNGGV